MIKKIIAVSLLVMGWNHGAFAQMSLTSIQLTGGKNYSSFVFRNSAAEKDEYLSFVGLNNYGASMELTAGRHVLRPELMFRQAGAESESDGLALSWRMNYLDLNLGYMYRLVETSDFSISPGVALGGGYMLNGFQYIGETRYSITDSEALKPFDIGFQAFTNFRAQVSPNFSVALEYRFGLGITQIENDATPQTTRNIYHAALLSLGYTLNNNSSARH
jgi:hypothetical protein